MTPFLQVSPKDPGKGSPSLAGGGEKPVEARPLSGVTGRTRWFGQGEKGISVAVQPEFVAMLLRDQVGVTPCGTMTR